MTTLKAIGIWALGPRIFYLNKVLYRNIRLVPQNSFSIFVVVCTDIFPLKTLSNFRARAFLSILMPVSSQVPSTMPGQTAGTQETLLNYYPPQVPVLWERKPDPHHLHNN